MAIDSGMAGADLSILAALTTIFAGVTMITNVRYYSFKDINLRKSVPFVAIAGIALVFALLALRPEVTLFGVFVIYALSGYVLAGVRLARRKSSAAE